MSNTPYCLDEIHTEQSCDDNPDWFELHITVVIGDLRIPFTRFQKTYLEEKREFLLPDGVNDFITGRVVQQIHEYAGNGNSKQKKVRIKAYS